MLNFIKACSLGNDFIFIKMTNSLEDIDLSTFSKKLANRRQGVGCDQLLFFEEKEREIFVRFFNQDGSEAESCGNGIRSLAFFLMEEKNIKELSFQTKGGTVFCEKGNNKEIITYFGIKGKTHTFLRLENPGFDEFPTKGYYINVGNPHLVCFVKDVPSVSDILLWGPFLETYPYQINKSYASRVNVGFVHPLSKETLALRVWERGAGYTRGCGTGALAAVVVCLREGLVFQKVNVIQEGGSLLSIVDDVKNEGSITGEVKIIYQGQFSVEDFILKFY